VALIFALAVAIFGLGACTNAPAIGDAGAPIPDGAGVDAVNYRACTALCLRPSDCQIAYPDDDICPAGFVCSRSFSCPRDGG
jgi:hypothetical protein